MRRLRMSLAGTVMVALLGGLGAVVVAQAETGPLHATGTLHRTQTTTGEVSFVDGVFRYRGSSLAGTLDVSDPRLSGDLWSIWNYDELGPAGSPGTVAAGTFGVENEEGSWTGTFSGVQYPGSTETLVQGWLTGLDAFDGLSAYLAYVHHGTGPMSVESMVFPGVLPPFPERPAE